MEKDDTQPEGGKKNYHHGDLRSALVAAARDMLAEVGLEKLSLRAVAKRAGVSQAAPYHHFKSKDELLDAVGAEGFLGLRQSLLDYAAADEQDYMRGLGVGYVMFAIKNPALFRLMQGGYFNDKTSAVHTATAADASFGALMAGIRETLPDADEEAIVIKAAAAWSIVHGLATLMIDGRLKRALKNPIDEEEIARQVTGQLDL